MLSDPLIQSDFAMLILDKSLGLVHLPSLGFNSPVKLIQTHCSTLYLLLLSTASLSSRIVPAFIEAISNFLAADSSLSHCILVSRWQDGQAAHTESTILITYR